MLLASDAINASGFALWMLFLHVNLQCLLVLVMPITLGTLEGLTGVPGDIPGLSTSHPGGAEDDVTLGAFHPSGTAIDVVRASPNGCTLEHVGIGGGQVGGGR